MLRTPPIPSIMDGKARNNDMPKTDLFVEVFPIERQRIPQLTAYTPIFTQAPTSIIGEKLAYRLSRTFAGVWVWVDGHILTNESVSPVQMDITLDLLRNQVPDWYAHLEAVQEDARWRRTASAAAQYVAHTAVREAESEIRDVLKPMGRRIPNGYILRDYLVSTWVAEADPALSLSIRSHIAYDRNAGQYISQTSPDEAIGLCVMDRTAASMIGTIIGISGTLGDQREALLELTRRDVMRRFINAAPDEDVVVQVQSSGGNEYEYPASALRLLIRPNEPEDWERFGIPVDAATNAMHLAPDVRAKIVSMVSDVLKNRGIIGNAYNSRQNDDLFAMMDFMPSLVFADKRVRPYVSKTLATDFVQNGLFERHQRFENKPIRLGVINTLDDGADDFVEALSRQLEKDFGYEINLIKQRNVRVVNEKNIASAVRVVEKEDPHVILAFFADAMGELDANYEALKSLTLGKGIASHAIYETTMHNPDAMDLVIMGVLAKTGNVPFALAEPLEYADFVVGLDVVREQLTRGDRIVVMARIYRRDGAFVQYLMATEELDSGDPIPLAVWQAIFPEDIFAEKHIILHYDGYMPQDVLDRLHRWASVLNSRFLPIEILHRDVPRLYGLEGGITQAPWGSVFRVNDAEAFVVSSEPAQGSTPLPLYLRVPDMSLPIEQAIYSVLAWTLLHYGTLGTPKLPVTIQHAEDMAQWLARGILPDNTVGDVPFWL